MANIFNVFRKLRESQEELKSIEQFYKHSLEKERLSEIDNRELTLQIRSLKKQMVNPFRVGDKVVFLHNFGPPFNGPKLYDGEHLEVLSTRATNSYSTENIFSVVVKWNYRILQIPANQIRIIRNL